MTHTALGVRHVVLHLGDEVRVGSKAGLEFGDDDGGDEHDRSIVLFAGQVAVVLGQLCQAGPTATVEFDQRGIRAHDPSYLWLVHRCSAPLGQRTISPWRSSGTSPRPTRR